MIHLQKENYHGKNRSRRNRSHRTLGIFLEPVLTKHVYNCFLSFRGNSALIRVYLSWKGDGEERTTAKLSYEHCVEGLGHLWESESLEKKKEGLSYKCYEGVTKFNFEKKTPKQKTFDNVSEHKEIFGTV